MTRHSKNATAGPTYTHHEKTKDSQQSGYGTKEARLSKDAIKDFDCCSLSLQPCRKPVITLEGFVFEKEAILEYILHKKVENAKMMKKFEKQRERKEIEKRETSQAPDKAKLDRFFKAEGKLVANTSTYSNPTKKNEAKAAEAKSVSNMSAENQKNLPSFWVPSLGPSSSTQAPMKKPDTTIYCPMSGKPLGMKDLVDMKFKLIEDKSEEENGGKKKALIVKDARYVCAVTNDVLSNSVPCVVLRTSGSVVTAEACSKIIKKEMIDPINGKKMVDRDFIYIQRGGTGYAGSGVKLKSSVATPAMVS